MDSTSSAGLNQQFVQPLQLKNPLNTNLTNQRILRLGAAPNSAPVLIDTAVSLTPVEEDAVVFLECHPKHFIDEIETILGQADEQSQISCNSKILLSYSSVR